jgi:predicted ArsR family transcriptional regulator
MEDAQSSLVTLSSARGHVLDAVKRRGEASADEVATSLGITPSAVRQHLATLKSGGLVASRQERGRSGRPTDLSITPLNWVRPCLAGPPPLT